MGMDADSATDAASVVGPVKQFISERKENEQASRLQEGAGLKPSLGIPTQIL
jgi:hypothetical protein